MCFFLAMLTEWGSCCWQSYLSDTQLQKWCGDDQGCLERACVLEWTIHEYEPCIFESPLAGEKIGLWGSLPVEETKSLSH